MSGAPEPRARGEGSKTAAEAIREARISRGLSQEALGRRAGIRRVDVVEIEKGRSGVGPARAKRLARALRWPSWVPFCTAWAEARRKSAGAGVEPAAAQPDASPGDVGVGGEREPGAPDLPQG